MSGDFEILGYFTTALRVRFGETDRFGYMWHGWVLAYFERARSKIAREHDLTASQMLDEFDLIVPMVDLDIAYKHLASDDEELVVQATLLRPRLRMPFLDFHYRVVKKDGAEVVRGRTRQVFMKTNGRISTRLPAELARRLDTVYERLTDCPRWEDSYVAALLEAR